MLRLYQPCLPTRVYAAPAGPRWVFDLKLDGFRIVARKTATRITLQTKEGYDYTERYPLIVDALKRMLARSIVLDGEAMCGHILSKMRRSACPKWIRNQHVARTALNRPSAEV
jgi:ATP-dependent DNA ligase